jgi:hypothetical protein
VLLLGHLANVSLPLGDAGLKTIQKVFIGNQVVKVRNLDGAFFFFSSFNAPRDL